MKYRAEAAETGDYQFGVSGVFLTDTPAAVAQAIKTRLLLIAGEWFPDLDEGVDYSQIQGHGTEGTRDLVIRQAILDTPGVTELVSYQSNLTAERKFTVTATVLTQYGDTQITQEI